MNLLYPRSPASGAQPFKSVKYITPAQLDIDVGALYQYIVAPC